MSLDELSMLAQSFGCTVKYGEPLSKHTTFHIGGPCSMMIIPNSCRCLSELIKFINKENIRSLVMGKGSNMLCSDEGFDGVVLLLDNTFGSIELVSDDIIRAEAGAPLIALCTKALEHGLSGLEFAYGIPGTVGGGIYMNAGAYGGEMKDIVVSVDAIDKNGVIHTYTADQLDFGYRTSRFADNGEVIISGDFKLTHGDKAEIEGKMNELMGRRRSKQPLDYPNAGSTFKRPEGQFAGKLIQDSGLRGVTVGGAQVSEKHCGFVINKNGATCEDVKTLIGKVQDTVLEKTGFMLECEIRIIPYK